MKFPASVLPPVSGVPHAGGMDLGGPGPTGPVRGELLSAVEEPRPRDRMRVPVRGEGPGAGSPVRGAAPPS